MAVFAQNNGGYFGVLYLHLWHFKKRIVAIKEIIPVDMVGAKNLSAWLIQF